MGAEGESTDLYLVVVNEEEQYSIWRSDLSIPAGWRATHGPCAKDQALAHISEVWKDLRPRSARV